MDEKPEVTVRDLIDYLSKFNPDTAVFLDHDGWDIDVENVEDKISYLMYPITHENETYILVNN